MPLRARVAGHAAVIAAALALAGCGTLPDSGDTGSTPNPGGSPQASPTTRLLSRDPTPGIRLAQRQFELLSQGKWADAWQDWTSQAQQEVKKDVFVKVNTTCPADKGVHFQLAHVNPLNDSTVELRFRDEQKERGAVVRYVGKAWKFEPDSATLAEYASGVNGAVAQRKSKQGCTAG